MTLPVMTASAAPSLQAATETPTPSATNQLTTTATIENTTTPTATTTAEPTNTVTATAQATSTVTATTTTQPSTTVTATAQPTSTLAVPSSTNTAVPPTPVPPLSGTRIHIVRPGETLFCIGRAYRVWPFAIAEVNHIWWPYTIYPNQKLRIPTTVWSPIPAGPTCLAQFSPSAPTPTTTVTPTSAAPTTCRATYTVRRGDTLYRIALSYGTNYIELARVNQISNVRLIYVGQRLCIP